MVSTLMYGVVTSFNEPRKDGMETERWNLLKSKKEKILCRKMLEERGPNYCSI